MDDSMPILMNPICRLLVMDENPLCRLGISRWIEHEAGFSLLGVSGSAEELLKMLDDGVEVDVVVLDLPVRDGGGFGLIDQLHRRDSGVRILLFSWLPEEVFAQRAIHAGAAGFISKSRKLETFRLAVSAVASGGTYLSERLAEPSTLKDLGLGASLSPSALEGLSNRELQVFRLIGEGQSTRSVADALHLSIKTVETYIEHLKRKLGIDSRVGLAHRAVQWVEQGDGIAVEAMSQIGTVNRTRVPPFSS